MGHQVGYQVQGRPRHHGDQRGGEGGELGPVAPDGAGDAGDDQRREFEVIGDQADGFDAVAAHAAGVAPHLVARGTMTAHRPPPAARRMSARWWDVQLVAHVEQGVVLALLVRGEGGADGGDQVGALVAGGGQFGAELVDFGDQGGSVGQGVEDVAPQVVDGGGGLGECRQ
ncbi:hypothetical protein AB0J35_25830 [Nonomuraea angiospora]|uniref:hypothetical protein n=1 Tax=Nonomuraea angiospora TaxID=46172 RepID=UPI003415F897